MTMWADNIKFVKDIIDSKYSKIDHAVAEVSESSEALLKDANCAKSRDTCKIWAENSGASADRGD